MATAFASSASATKARGNPALTDTLTITKPTGLSAGDLMVAVVGSHGQSGSSWQEPSGWSTLDTDGDGNFGIKVFCKVADSADASASDFSFVIAIGGAGNDGLAGVLTRYTGNSFAGSANIQIETDANTSATATHTFTPGLSPSTIGSIFMLGSFVRATATTTQSAYAITNNNPSWTEREDVYLNTTKDAAIAFATATSTSTSSTGDYSLTLNNSAEAVGFLIIITESTNVSTTIDAPGILNLSQGGSHDLILDNTFVLDTAGILTLNSGEVNIINQENTVWTEETKNSSTVWVEDNK